LRAHRDAFASDDVTPLVPTLMGGVFAHRFAAKRKVVYTLWNTRHRTSRGPVLTLPHRAGARYFDAWNGKPLLPTRTGDSDVIALSIGPRDVGCIVCTW